MLAENARLNKAIGDDETGFRGTADRPYRTEGWAFLLAGGSVYSNLDYSFTPDHEDGTAAGRGPHAGRRRAGACGASSRSSSGSSRVSTS